MGTRKARSLSVSVLTVIALWAMAAWSLDSQSGDWTLSKSEVQGSIHFSLIRNNAHGGNFQSSSDWPLSQFQGLNVTPSGRHDVKFAVVREAGRFECEGFLNSGEGAGLFRFLPNPQYVEQMKALGFEGIDGDKQMAMAIHDVTVEFARQMQAEHITGLDTDKLIAFRIHGVSPEFIGKLRDLGYTHPEADQLIAFRIHGVTPDYIVKLQSRGMHDLSAEQLISLRIHGID